jgi:glycosyltransferase involved in cell wall biosynthesis
MTRVMWDAYCAARSERAALYHFHDPELMIVGLLLRAEGYNVIFDVHENVPDQLLYKAWIPARLRPFISASYDHFETLVARAFSVIVTANEDINVRFQAVNRNVVAIHNYSDLSEFLNLERDPERYTSGRVLHCGGITNRTAIEPVIDAIANVPSELNPQLIITGHSDSLELARRLETKAGWKRAQSLELLPRPEMITLLGTAAVSLVLYDGFENHSNIRSNRLYESMAAGLAVIVPHFPEWKAMVENIGCGVAVDPLDAEAIASALSWLLSHPEETAAMGERGRQAVKEQFNWTSEKAKLAQLYQSLVEHKNASRVPNNVPVGQHATQEKAI